MTGADSRRRALVFAAQCAGLLVAFLALYSRVHEPYESVVVSATSACLGTLDPPMRLARNEAGYWNAFVRDPGGGETFFWGRPPANLHLFFLGIALLPPLLLATPVPWRQRLRLLGIGLALLFLSHVAAAMGLVLAQHHLRMVNAGSVFWDWVKTLTNTAGQLGTFVIWALLTWDVWLGRGVAGGGGEAAAGDPG